jgi:3-dehydroquinate synthase
MAHRRAGLAEAIKHGIVADAAHLARIEATLPALLDAEPGALVECVSRSVALKRAIVAQDPRESGRRRVLNFGHTLGHALEVVSGYALLHGEAVSIGMVLEARLAERRGVAPAGTAGRVREVLQRAGLPVERPVELDVEAVVRATRQDKKRVAGAVGYALPAGIGCMAGESSGWLVPVDDALVREVLA